jgi:ribosomal protein S27E
MFSTITTKYECPDCGAIFDTPAGHRKHYQAFHGKIEEPKVIEQAEI